MTRTAARSSAVLLSALLWILPGGIQSAERSQDPRVSLAESPAQAVRQILAGWDDSRVRARIDTLGERIAVQSAQAAEVLDLLEQDGSIEAATLRGDLLVWIARGDETPRWKQKDRKFQPDDYQAKLAKWMYRNMAANLTHMLDEPTAARLETIAWDEWQIVRKRLDGPP